MKLLLTILVLVTFLGVTTPYFLTKANLVTLVDNMALEVVALSGYTLLLAGGFFDLSTDGVVGLSGIVGGILMNAGIPWPLAFCTAMLLAGGIGTLNGMVIVKLKIDGLIATLTTWWICIGISLGITGAVTQYGFPDSFQLIGQARFLGFRLAVLYAAIAVAITSIVLHWTPIGAHIYASGDNRQAAQLMGIKTVKLGIGMYVLMGLLAGFIGLVMAARMNAATTMAVDGMTLRVIAASVIGGANLRGGKGSVIGGLLGLCILHILSNSIIQLGISPYWQKAVLGGALLTAVLVKNRRKR
jgi:ribose transport system permease protein